MIYACRCVGTTSTLGVCYLLPSGLSDSNINHIHSCYSLIFHFGLRSQSQVPAYERMICNDMSNHCVSELVIYSLFPRPFHEHMHIWGRDWRRTSPCISESWNQTSTYLSFCSQEWQFPLQIFDFVICLKLVENSQNESSNAT